MRGVLTLCVAILLATWGYQTAFSAVAGADKGSFSMNLFSEIAKSRKNKNLLVSPYSVSSALSMTHPGAAGETKKVLGDVLGLSGDESYKKVKETADSLQNPGGGTTLEIANALFGNQKVTFEPEYLATCKEWFNAPIKSLNFATGEAVKVINEFVNEKTHGKIPKILDQTNDGMVLVLVNALYFKGTWENEFEKANTQAADFNTASGGTKKVQMMNRSSENFQYFENGDVQAIKLRYADKRLSLCVFLPKAGKTVEAFEAGLSSAKWAEYMSSFGKREGHLGLPRFKVEDEMELNTALKAIGLGLAFDPDKADFSKMAKIAERVFISAVFHKTFMEVNEEGTEAAAATAVVMAATMAPMKPVPPFEMIVDRPFFIALHDDKTGEDLFLGHIVNP